MNTLFKKKLLKLGAILFVGFLLRIIFINSSPPALYGDELTIALDANSLLHTGQDELGNFLPLTFPMGAGRPGGYIYGSIPFVALFGPTALGVRSLSILSGIGIILLLYFLGRQLFSEKAGILAAFLAAVSPWDISLSRGGFEAHFALFLSLLGAYLFLAAGQRPLLYIFSGLSFGLSLHTYPTYKMTLLLFLPLLLWYVNRGREILRNKYFLSGVFVVVVFGILALSQTFFSGSELRFADINILSQGKLKSIVEQKINLERQISYLPRSMKKYFHNKPVEYTKVFLENYLQNFSLDFLILHGDRNPRHNMATMGVLYAVEIILISLGILNLWQRDRRVIYLLLSWIFLAPVAGSVIDFPHALRSSFMMPPLILFSALGLMVILNYRNTMPLILVSVLFIIQFVFLLQKLFFLSSNEYSNFWSYPAKLAAEIAIQNRNKYDYIVLSSEINDIEYAYPVYNRLDPREVIEQNREKGQLLGYPVKQFDNVFIGHPQVELEKFLKNIPGSYFYIGPISDKNRLGNYDIIMGIDKSEVLLLRKN